MRAWVVVLLAGVVALGAAAPAGARENGPIVVLGPAGGPRLELSQRGARVCVAVLRAADATAQPNCAAVPAIDLFSAFALEDIAPPRVVGGAVRADVARVEYVLANGRSVGADTVAAPATAPYAAGLRFFLVELPSGAEPVTRRLLDASGAVVDEHDGHIAGSPAEGPEALAGPFVLRRGRVGRTRWTLRAQRRAMLLPVRGDAGRRVDAACLSAGSRRARTSICLPAAVDPLVVAVAGACDPRPLTIVFGAVTARVARVEVVLGDGTRQRARPTALPTSISARTDRVFVLAIPLGSAVRELVARDAGGRVVAREALGLAPPELGCGAFGAAGNLRAGERLAAPATVGTPGEPGLLVADAGPELCAAVGRSPGPRDCEPPAPGAASTVLAASADGRLLGGAVDPRIRSLEIVQSDGRHRRVATDAGAAYRGRYAGRVRFFSAAATHGTVIVGAYLIGPGGRRVFPIPGARRVPLRGRARPLVSLRTPGGRVAVAEALVPGVPRAERCLVLAVSDRAPRTSDACVARRFESDVVWGTVRCDLRAAVIAGGVGRSRRAVRATLDDGSVVAARIVRTAHGRAFILSPPPERAVRRLDWLDRRGRRVHGLRLPVPAARAQCGYRFLGL